MKKNTSNKACLARKTQIAIAVAMLNLPMLAVPDTGYAAVDMFLKISDIKGESKYTVVGTKDGKPVFQNTRGEQFTVGPEGDFKFLSNKFLDKTTPTLEKAAADIYIKIEGIKGDSKFTIAGAKDERTVFKNEQGEYFSVKANGDLQFLDGAVFKFFRPNPKGDGTTEGVVIKWDDVKNENRYSVAGSSEGHPVYRNKQGGFFTLEDGSGDMKFLPVDAPIKSAEGIFLKYELTNVLVSLRNGEPVWKNAKGEYFTVDKANGDLHFFESRDSKHKGEIDVLSWGRDAKGNTVYEKPNGEKFKLNEKNGDMIFVDTKDVIPFHAPDGNPANTPNLTVRKAGEHPVEYLQVGKKHGDIDVSTWSWRLSQSGTMKWHWGETQSGTKRLPQAGDPVNFEGKQGVVRLANGEPTIDWGDGTSSKMSFSAPTGANGNLRSEGIAELVGDTQKIPDPNGGNQGGPETKGKLSPNPGGGGNDKPTNKYADDFTQVNTKLDALATQVAGVPQPNPGVGGDAKPTNKYADDFTQINTKLEAQTAKPSKDHLKSQVTALQTSIAALPTTVSSTSPTSDDLNGGGKTGIRYDASNAGTTQNGGERKLPSKEHHYVGTVTLVRRAAPNASGNQSSERLSLNFAHIEYEYHEIGHEGPGFKVSATPDEQGKFILPKLPEGDYTISAPGQPDKLLTVGNGGTIGGKFHPSVSGGGSGFFDVFTELSIAGGDSAGAGQPTTGGKQIGPASEIFRAKAAESDLSSAKLSENTSPLPSDNLDPSERKSKDVIKLNTVNDKLVNEVARATPAETTLTTNLNNEIHSPVVPNGSGTVGPAPILFPVFAQAKMAAKVVGAKPPDDENGKPGIIGILIALLLPSVNGADMRFSTTTDQNGNFNFDKLPEGKYKLKLPDLPEQSLTVGSGGNFGGKVMKGAEGEMMIFDRWGNLIFEAAPKGTGPGPLKSTDGQNGTAHVGGGANLPSKLNPSYLPDAPFQTQVIHHEGDSGEVGKTGKAGPTVPPPKIGNDKSVKEEAGPVGFGNGGPGSPSAGPSFGGMNGPGPGMIPGPVGPGPMSPGPMNPGPMSPGPAGPGGAMGPMGSPGMGGMKP